MSCSLAHPQRKNFESLKSDLFDGKDQRTKATLVEQMNDSLLMEYLSNVRTLERSTDQYVSCNIPFQLLHVASNKFLASVDAESNSEKENRSLLLTEFPSASTLFSLAPIYKHQSDRDNLAFYGEEFYLLSHTKYLKEKLYLHVSPINLENLMLEEINKSKTRRKGIKKVGCGEAVRGEPEHQREAQVFFREVRHAGGPPGKQPVLREPRLAEHDRVGRHAGRAADRPRGEELQPALPADARGRPG